MKLTSATALVVALCAAGAGTTYVVTRRPIGPAELVLEVRSELGTTRFDQRTALRRLTNALDSANSRGNKELAIEVFETQSVVYLEVGDKENAIAALMRIEPLRPDDFVLQLRIAELLKEVGETELALDSALEITDLSPMLPAAWELLGHLKTGAARSTLAPLIDKVDSSLPTEDAALATDLLITFASLDEGDPRYPTLDFELESAFKAELSEDYFLAKTFLPDVRTDYASARVAFARAIALEPTAERVLALSHSLVEARQRPLAISLLKAALRVPSLTDAFEIHFELAELLQRANRLEEARALLGSTKWPDVGKEHYEFLTFAAKLLYDLGETARLRAVAARIEQLGSVNGKYAARFYKHIFAIDETLSSDEALRLYVEGAEGSEKSGPAKAFARIEFAFSDLKKFINETASPEPFFGARSQANLELSRICKIRERAGIGSPQTEIAALRKGLKNRALQTADSWVQLARALQKPERVNWLEVDRAMSNAINLEPLRHAEFAEEWRQAGKKCIKAKGMTVGDLINEANRTKTALPSVSGIGPAGYTLLAQQHLENKSSYMALQSANRALQDHPRLVPAMDVAIAAKIVTPRYNATIEGDIVRRITMAGVDDGIEDCLRRLPDGPLDGPLDGKNMIAAIKASPERFGKAEVARWLLESGDSTGARENLRNLDRDSAPSSLLLLRAKAYVEEGSLKKALEDITSIEVGRGLGQEAAVLKAKILLKLGQPSSLPQIMRQLTWAQASTESLLELADLFLTNDQADLALEIIDGLDQASETRTDAFYRRRILVDILTSRQRGAEVAQESIERSRAYLQDGTPEIASILLAVIRRKWTSLPSQIARLRDSEFARTDQKEAALTLLEERLESGRRLASAGLERNQQDPIWALVSAAGDAMVSSQLALPPWFGSSADADMERLLTGSAGRTSRDPRETLAMLLIADLPEWGAWLLPIIKKVSEESGSSIWTGYLEALVHEANGDVSAMTATVERLNENHPRFGPAYDWNLQLTKAQHPLTPFDPDVVTVRNRRLAYLTEELIDDPVEVALAKAGAFRRILDTGSAMRTLRAVLRDAGDSKTEVRLMMGWLAVEEENWAAAAEHYFAAALGDPGIYTIRVINSLLGILDGSAKQGADQEGTLSKKRAAEMLAALGERYPLDPMVTLRRLQLSDLDRGAWGDWAKNALDALYRNSGRQPLEAIRPGSTRPWVDLLMDIRIDLARSIVERDLEHEPGNLVLWRLRAEIASALNDDAAAAEIYRALIVIDRSALSTGYELAEIMIAQGRSMTDVTEILEEAGQKEGGGGARSVYLSALAETRTRNPKLGQIIRRLKEPWKARDRAASGVDPTLLGELYVEALLALNRPEDQQEVSRVLADLAKKAPDVPYRSVTVTAMQGLHTRSLQEAGTR